LPRHSFRDKNPEQDDIKSDAGAGCGKREKGCYGQRAAWGPQTLRQIRFSSRFKKDYKRRVKQNKNIALLNNVIEKLAAGEMLPPNLRNHSLFGNLKGYRELHLSPDWLLIYRMAQNELQLARLGSHSELFD
jgi:mRNA interferase YafQ